MCFLCLLSRNCIRYIRFRRPLGNACAICISLKTKKKFNTKCLQNYRISLELQALYSVNIRNVPFDIENFIVIPTQQNELSFILDIELAVAFADDRRLQRQTGLVLFKTRRQQTKWTEIYYALLCNRRLISGCLSIIFSIALIGIRRNSYMHQLTTRPYNL